MPENDAKPARSRLRADTFAASVAILLVVTIVQRSVGFGRGILFGRWLSPHELGQWDLAYGFLLLAAPLAVLGVPGSFGRYAEHYRQRGQLRAFLRRSMLWTGLCCIAAMLVIAWGAPLFAEVIFNSARHATLTVGIAYCVGAVILLHTLTSLLTSLRLYRVVSAMAFAQSLLFAIVALTLVWRTPTAASVLIGYGSACLIASLGALVWSWPGLHEIEKPPATLPHRDFWPKLLRFAFFVWVANVLSHLFTVTDRMMLVHYSGMSPAEAMVQVGQYHSSRIVPLLLISFADLLGGLLLPHLSADWEAGRKPAVSKRLNLTLKLVAVGMLAFGVCVLFFSPFLFGVLLEGKYDGGLRVLPWMLAGCVWAGLYTIAQNYLWCAERTRLATLPLLFGLTANVILNLILLPIYGLYGAVLATAVATLICLVVVLRINRRQGMQVDLGTWLIAGAPAVLGCGLATAFAALVVLALVMVKTNLVLDRGDRCELIDVVSAALEKYLPSLRSTSAPAR